MPAGLAENCRITRGSRRLPKGSEVFHRFSDPLRDRRGIEANGAAGADVRQLRKQRNWTQVYMAEDVGMDRSYISDLENGRKEICIRNLQLLARAFEMNIAK